MSGRSITTMIEKKNIQQLQINIFLINKIICADNCYSCTEPYKCDNCKDGYKINQGQCTIICADYCYSCTEPYKCDNCKDGYKINQGQCTIICADNCYSCTEPYKCDICKDGHQINQGQCTIICADNCQSCTEPYKCDNCTVGYQINQGQCTIICADYCQSCTEPYKCDICKDGYQIHQGQSMVICADNCQSCTEPYKCDNCTDGYQINQGQCTIICADYCQSCTEPYKCDICKDGYQINQGYCMITCADNCQTQQCDCGENCNECNQACNCVICKDGYQINEGKCDIISQTRINIDAQIELGRILTGTSVISSFTLSIIDPSYSSYSIFYCLIASVSEELLENDAIFKVEYFVGFNSRTLAESQPSQFVIILFSVCIPLIVYQIATTDINLDYYLVEVHQNSLWISIFCIINRYAFNLIRPTFIFLTTISLTTMEIRPKTQVMFGLSITLFILTVSSIIIKCQKNKDRKIIGCTRFLGQLLFYFFLLVGFLFSNILKYLVVLIFFIDLLQIYQLKLAFKIIRLIATAVKISWLLCIYRRSMIGQLVAISLITFFFVLQFILAINSRKRFYFSNGIFEQKQLGKKFQMMQQLSSQDYQN